VTVGFGSDGAITGKDPIGWTEFHEKYLVAGDPTGETMSAGVVAGLLTADAAAGSAPVRAHRPILAGDTGIRHAQ
jgi:hypothetical protein